MTLRVSGLGLAVLIALTPVPPAVAATSSQKPAAPQTLDLATGKADYMTYCAACHGTDAMGGGSVAEFLTLQPPALALLAHRAGGKFPADMVARVIDGREIVKVHGTRDMPVWGDWFRMEAASDKVNKAKREEVVAARIANLVGYLASIQKQ